MEDGPYEDLEGNPVDIGNRYYRQAPTETEEFIGGINTALLWKPSLGNKYTAKIYYSFYDLKDFDLELRDYYEDEEIEKLNDVKLEPKHVFQVAFGGQICSATGIWIIPLFTTVESARSCTMFSRIF